MSMPRLSLTYAFIPMIVLFAIVAVYYFDFVAEDSYIVARYAENLVDEGALEYNIGEPINALTSPAFALLEALIYRVSGATITGWKIVALILLLASVALVGYALRGAIYAQLLATAILLLSPSIILWTLGGLETPLVFFLITLLGVLVYTTTDFASNRLYLICGVAGLAFLARYDTVPLTGPLVLYAINRARDLKRSVRALALGAVLPVAWLAVSQLYYGDLLPTSYYEKTPDFFELDNLLYIGFYPFPLHLIPWGLALVVWTRTQRQTDVLRARLERWRWLRLGTLLVLVYGALAAADHMLFSFRLLLPFVPIYVLLLADLTKCSYAALEGPAQRRRFSLFFAALLAGIMLSQAFQAYFTYTRSVNGLYVWGEYGALGVRDYVTFMDTLAKNADDTAAHWHSLDRPDPPRITTFAAGILPYRYREAYIYSALVSFRHHCRQVYNLTPPYSDYVHVLTPRHGLLEDQLLQPVDHYQLVSSYTIQFDGEMETFAVYYNPDPLPHRLPPGINDPCDVVAEAQAGID
jgi:arabinofuranosyltransferase